MHQRRTLTVRNPLKPVPERLPCKLSREEKYQRTERRFALERTVEDLDAQIAEVKARAKAQISEIADERAELATEMRTIREQVLTGEEQRLVDCLLLEDLEEGALYVFRLDTGEVVTRKDIRPEELRELRAQPELPLGDRVTKTVDIPDGVEVVQRFDSDPPGVEEGEPWERSDDATADLLSLIGRDDIPFETVQAWTDEQCRAVETWAAAAHERADGEEWPDAPAWLPEPVVVEEEPEPKPKLKKGGRGKRNGEGVPDGAH